MLLTRVLERWWNRLMDGTEFRAWLTGGLMFIFGFDCIAGFVVLIASSLLSGFSERVVQMAVIFFQGLGMATISILGLFFIIYLSVAWEDLIDEKRKVNKNYGITLREALTKELDFERWCE